MCFFFSPHNPPSNGCRRELSSPLWYSQRNKVGALLDNRSPTVSASDRQESKAFLSVKKRHLAAASGSFDGFEHWERCCAIAHVKSFRSKLAILPLVQAEFCGGFVKIARRRRSHVSAKPGFRACKGCACSWKVADTEDSFFWEKLHPRKGRDLSLFFSGQKFYI